jgi:hypothetical protein
MSLDLVSNLTYVPLEAMRLRTKHRTRSRRRRTVSDDVSFAAGAAGMPSSPRDAHSGDEVSAGSGEASGGPRDRGVNQRIDLAIAIVLAGIAIWLLIESTRLPESSIPDPLGEAGFVRGLAGLVLVLSASLVFRTVRELRGGNRQAREPEPGPPAPAEMVSRDGTATRAFSIYACLIGFVFLLPLVGYPIAALVFLLTALPIMRVRGWFRLTLLSVAATAITYAVFVGVFGVLLPLGVFERWSAVLWFHIG